jgi:replication factor C subunit 2/4
MSLFSSRGSSSTGGPVKKARQLPWVEKYRPKTVDDVAHQNEIITNLKGAMESGNVSSQAHFVVPLTNACKCF